MVVLAIGIFLISMTIVIHAVGAAYWLLNISRQSIGRKGGYHSKELVLAVLWTAVVLLILHMVEVFLWAVAYHFLPGRAGLTDFSEALYFSIVTFTTLGYGDITLNADWRLLSGMEAMVGITVFGLTTAILFAVVQKAWHAVNTPHSS